LRKSKDFKCALWSQKYGIIIINVIKGKAMMIQEKGLDQWMSNQFCNFDDMIHKRVDLFHRSSTTLNI